MDEAEGVLFFWRVLMAQLLTDISHRLAHRHQLHFDSPATLMILNVFFLVRKEIMVAQLFILTHIRTHACSHMHCSDGLVILTLWKMVPLADISDPHPHRRS